MSKTALKTCSEEGCDSRVQARGLCNSHYHAARRAGVVTPPLALAASTVDAVAEPVVDFVETLAEKPALLEGVSDRDWRAMLSLCEFFERDPRDVASGLLNDWLTQVRERLAAAEISI